MKHQKEIKFRDADSSSEMALKAQMRKFSPFLSQLCRGFLPFQRLGHPGSRFGVCSTGKYISEAEGCREEYQTCMRGMEASEGNGRKTHGKLQTIEEGRRQGILRCRHWKEERKGMKG